MAKTFRISKYVTHFVFEKDSSHVSKQIFSVLHSELENMTEFDTKDGFGSCHCLQ